MIFVVTLFYIDFIFTFFFKYRLGFEIAKKRRRKAKPSGALEAVKLTFLALNQSRPAFT